LTEEQASKSKHSASRVRTIQCLLLKVPCRQSLCGFQRTHRLDIKNGRLKSDLPNSPDHVSTLSFSQHQGKRPYIRYTSQLSYYYYISAIHQNVKRKMKKRSLPFLSSPKKIENRRSKIKPEQTKTENQTLGVGLLRFSSFRLGRHV